MKILTAILCFIVLTSARIITNPHMFLDTDNPATGIFINWKGGEGTIYYGVEDYDKSINGTNGVHLTNLQAHAKYQWYLEVDGDRSENGSFQLDPGVKNEDFRLAIFGDTQYMDKNVDSFFVYAASQMPDLLIILGDMVTRNNTQYIGWGDNYDSLVNKNPKLFANAIWMPVMGNHDFFGSTNDVIENDIRENWMAFFKDVPATLDPRWSDYQQVGRNYSFDYGPITFTVNYGWGSHGWTWNGLKDCWKTILDEKIEDDVLRPMVIGCSHYDKERKNSQYVGPVYQERRGVIWYNAHTHQHTRTNWLKFNSSGSMISESEIQKDGHMIYCHVGHPARESNMQKRMSIVDVTKDGMIYHNQYELADHSGKYDNVYPLTDEFTIDGTEMVDEYCLTHDCGQVDIPDEEILNSLESDGNIKIVNFTNYVNIYFNLAQWNSSKGLKVSIIGLNGKVIRIFFENQIKYNNGSFNLKWNTSNVASGFYMVNLEADNKKYSKQISLIR